MRVRGPNSHHPPGRKLAVSRADKCSEESDYKQSDEKFFHGDGVIVFIAMEVSQSSRELVEPNA